MLQTHWHRSLRVSEELSRLKAFPSENWLPSFLILTMVVGACAEPRVVVHTLPEAGPSGWLALLGLVLLGKVLPYLLCAIGVLLIGLYLVVWSIKGDKFVVPFALIGGLVSLGLGVAWLWHDESVAAKKYEASRAYHVPSPPECAECDAKTEDEVNRRRAEKQLSPFDFSACVAKCRPVWNRQIDGQVWNRWNPPLKAWMPHCRTGCERLQTTYDEYLQCLGTATLQREVADCKIKYRPWWQPVSEGVPDMSPPSVPDIQPTRHMPNLPGEGDCPY